MWSRRRAGAWRSLARWTLCIGIAPAAVCGCAQRMDEQAKMKPLRESTFFEDGRSARPLVQGTIPQGPLPDPYLDEGREGKGFATRYPFPVTRAVLERGQQRFDIYCAVCHDRTGSGHGMIVRRGFPKPPDFHEARLRAAPPGLIVATIANGVGPMFPYGDRVEPKDRWAIAAYIKALQLHDSFPVAKLSAKERGMLEAAK